MTAMRHLPPLTRRRRLLAAVLLLPSIVAALGVGAVETWRAHQPSASRISAPFVYSLGDAIASGEVQHAYAFIRAGQDPNHFITVRDPALTGGRWVFVSPLVWAVAAQKKSVVLMLLAFGARLERRTDRAAACLADMLGNAEIATVLRHDKEALSAAQCPPRKTGDAPLLSFIDGTENEPRESSSSDRPAS